ncbi:MAG: hypothetical protein ACNA7J_04495 [Wenzhouxiangella sp.]
MVMRFLAGLVAGLLVGYVLFEALLSGFQLLTPDTDINANLAQGKGLANLPAVALTSFWGLAATVSAAMATAIARLNLAGWLAGALWCVSALFVTGLGGLNDLAVAAAVVVCLAGAVLGNRAARLAST